MRRFGFRAFKRPFDSKEICDIVFNLERYERTINLVLQAKNALIGVYHGAAMTHGGHRRQNAPSTEKPWQRPACAVVEQKTWMRPRWQRSSPLPCQDLDRISAWWVSQ